MAPLQPPLPTDSSLPFQPDSGIQTSILTSESVVGLSVAATRQTWLAGTSSAAVMVACGSVSFARSPQDAAHTGSADKRSATVFTTAYCTAGVFGCSGCIST